MSMSITLKPEIRQYIHLFPKEEVLWISTKLYVSFFMKVTYSIILPETILIVLQQVLFQLDIFSLPDIGSVLSEVLYASIFLVIILGIVAYVLGIFYCRGHHYIITDRRIIIFVKFISISIRELEYPNITDVFLTIGPVGRLLNYGDIILVTAGLEYGLGSLMFSISGVRNPLEVRKIILSRIKEVVPVYEQNINK